MLRILVRSSFWLLASTCFAQSSTIVVAPGLTVPDGKTPWALDHFAGQIELVPIHYSSVKVNSHNGANIAGALTQSFFYKPKMTTELQGISAKTALHDPRPIFYFHLDDASLESLASFSLVSAKVEKDHRIVSTVRYTQLSNHATRNVGEIECSVEQVEGGWTKITPLKALAPGEYALTPLLKDPKLFALVVYDFSINEQAANAKDAIVGPAK